MNWNEKVGIVFAAVLFGCFIMDGVAHNAVWLVAVSGAVVAAAMVPWILATSKYRRRCEQAESKP